MKKGETFFLSLLLTISFFYFTFDVTEDWFWLSGNACYFFPLAFTGIYLRLKKAKRFKRTALFLRSLLMFLFGISIEIYPPFLIIALVMIFYFEFRNTGKLELKELIPILFLIMGFAILALAPGNDARLEYLQHPEVNYLKLLSSSFKHVVKFILMEQLIVIIPVFLLLINVVGKKVAGIISPKKAGRILTISSAYLIAVILGTFVLLGYAKGKVWPFRAWGLISFTIAIYFVIFSYCFSAFMQNKVQTIGKILSHRLIYWGSGIVLIAIIINTMIIQFPIAANYSRAFDRRKQILFEKQLEQNTNDVYLDSLPPSGFIRTAEISAFLEEEYLNAHVQMYYDLGFRFFVKREKNSE